MNVEPTLFVTLGTIKPYRFDSLVDAILESGLANDSTVWQLGCTARTNLPGRVFAEMSSAEFDAAARDAGVVVTHSGVGTILRLLEMGIHPVVVPRIQSRAEHVDDHQLQIASVIRQRDIGAVASPSEITASLLVASSGYKVKEVK
ncbi:glycosyltransferase [Rhodococcus sp. NPDC057529]|uniref:glycosyltransferase n=1 Tax=Rhodococcus sp. NPDC057529 TaxID=3346158 RepID=UPI00366DCC97